MTPEKMISSNQHQFIYFFTLNVIISPSFGQERLFIDEVRSLSELPMSQLIKIQSEFIGTDVSEVEVNEEEMESRMSGPEPEAMPLKSNNKKGIRRHGHGWEEEKGDSKISKIFQLALTTLSFLAFGGYLLTLVICAIKKNASAAGNNVIVLSNLEKYTRPKRRTIINDPKENEYDVDKMYRGMIMLAEGYTAYHGLRP